MAKYDEKFKLMIVNRYLSEGISFRALAREYEGLTHKSIYYWVTGYRAHGENGLKDRNWHNGYDPRFKLTVLKRMWRDNLMPFQVGVLFNIRGAHVVVPKWECQYHSESVGALAPKTSKHIRKMSHPTLPNRFRKKADAEKTQEELIQELEYMRAKAAYLKKLNALVQEKEKTPKRRK